MTNWNRTCAVPLCLSTTIKNPEKLFINVPKCQRRKQWLHVARRDPNYTSKRSTIFFCEDHFDLPNDMENYIQYTIMGSVSKIRMKPGCVPSKFACQTTRATHSAPKQPLSAVIKRQNKEIIQDIVSEKTDKPVLLSLTSNSNFPVTTESSHILMCQQMQSATPALSPSAVKRCCYGLESATNVQATQKVIHAQDALNTKTTGETYINAYDPENCIKEEHPELSCNVCHNDIAGFRYVCVQCVDWDICASCEARGEHPEHYVLRLPAPKPYVESESEAVLASIRQHIEDLLKLKNEFQENCIKEDIVEMKLEVDLDFTEANLTTESNDRSVPEAYNPLNTSTVTRTGSLCTLEDTEHMITPDNLEQRVDTVMTVEIIKNEQQEDRFLINETRIEIHERDTKLRLPPGEHLCLDCLRTS